MIATFLAGDADGQPAEVAHLRHRDVLAHLHPELLGVERERLVLVVHPDLHVCSCFSIVFLLRSSCDRRATLARRRAAVFSKPAGAGGRTPAARRSGSGRARGRRVRRAVGGRGHAVDAAEARGERADAAQADVEADVGDRPVGVAQQRGRPLHPAGQQVLVRRLAERAPELAAEVRAATGAPRGRAPATSSGSRKRASTVSLARNRWRSGGTVTDFMYVRRARPWELSGMLGRFNSREDNQGGMENVNAQMEKAILAGGCFWGMQDLIRKRPGVLSTRVGYTGGDVPTRRTATTGRTRRRSRSSSIPSRPPTGICSSSSSRSTTRRR